MADPVCVVFMWKASEAVPPNAVATLLSLSGTPPLRCAKFRLMPSNWSAAEAVPLLAPTASDSPLARGQWFIRPMSLAVPVLKTARYSLAMPLPA
ncbi:hypothetical protein D9M69_638930 [compost metagenome]